MLYMKSEAILPNAFRGEVIQRCEEMVDGREVSQ